LDLRRNDMNYLTEQLVQAAKPDAQRDCACKPCNCKNCAC